MAAGKEIKRLRGKDVTASKAAKFIGVGVDRLRKWEERDTNPTDTGDIQKVEMYFGCSLGDLAKLKEFDFVQFPRENEQVLGFTNSPGYVPASDLIQVLKEQNEFLRRNFETSLVGLLEGQQAASAHLKTLLRYNVEVANKEDPKRAEQDLIKVHSMLAFYAGVGGEEGNFHTDSSKSTSGQRKGS